MNKQFKQIRLMVPENITNDAYHAIQKQAFMLGYEWPITGIELHQMDHVVKVLSFTQHGEIKNYVGAVPLDIMSLGRFFNLTPDDVVESIGFDWYNFEKITLYTSGNEEITFKHKHHNRLKQLGKMVNWLHLLNELSEHYNPKYWMVNNKDGWSGIFYAHDVKRVCGMEFNTVNHNTVKFHNDVVEDVVRDMNDHKEHWIDLITLGNT